MSVRTLPDLGTIAGRLKAERCRLGLSQTAAASPAGKVKGTWIGWEKGSSFPTADALASFAEAGADVLFIVTGRHESFVAGLDRAADELDPAAEHPVPASLADTRATVAPVSRPIGSIVRTALAQLAPAERHRLLLDLLAEELRP